MGRLLTTIIAAALAVVGLFFVAFAVIAAAVLAAIFAIRIWWIIRKARVQRDKDIIEGSYSIEAEQIQRVPFYRSTSGDSNPPVTK
jgi:hypothetical protein